MTQPATRIGPYSVECEIGRGAMGVVYRAYDQRLSRSVAIKALADSVAADPERLARFRREAKVLAALNHPHIAGIHGVEEVEGSWYLVLEHVPGETLREALAGGPLSVEEALEFARQVADGLEAAHERGIVHRDLKPANIKSTPAGEVKILDFGLAKPGVGRGEEPVEDSTIGELTSGPAILGTPLYMSPEQTRGRGVDRRADVWAFGCILYEALTGRRAFEGDTSADLIHAVLEKEPDWSRLPTATPLRIRELLRRCLAKDPRQRLRDAGDARLELEAALAGREWAAAGKATHGRSGASWWLLAAGVLLAGTAGALLAGLFRGPPPVPTIPKARQVSLELGGLELWSDVRVSADGSAVLFEGPLPGSEEGGSRGCLYLRRLDSRTIQPLPGTEGSSAFAFSPDGAWAAVLVPVLGHEARFRLIKVPLRSGGAPVEIATFSDWTGNQIVWLENGWIIGHANDKRLVRIPADGSPALPRLAIHSLESEVPYPYQVFSALPGGRHVLARVFAFDEKGYAPRVVAIDVETGEETVVMRRADHGAYLEPGYFLFSRRDTLMVTRFDLDGLRPTGEAVPLLNGLRTWTVWFHGFFDVSREGTLVHLPGGVQGRRRQLMLVDSDGTVTPWSEERHPLDDFVLVSPDGSRFTVGYAGAFGNIELYGAETARPHLRQIAADPSMDALAGVPAPDGDSFYYVKIGFATEGSLYRGSFSDPDVEELLLEPSEPQIAIRPLSIHPSGEWLLLRQGGGGTSEILRMRLGEGVAPRAELLYRCSAGNRQHPFFSPEGRWIAYQTHGTGTPHAAIRRFGSDGEVGPEILVPSGALGPVRDVIWSLESEGQAPELLVRPTFERRLYRISVREEPLEFGEPELAFDLGDLAVMEYASVPGGRLLVLVRGEEEIEAERIELVFGLRSMIEEKLGPAR